MSVKRSALLALAVAASACASGGPKEPGVAESSSTPVNRDRNLITQAEIDANPTLKASSAARSPAR